MGATEILTLIATGTKLVDELIKLFNQTAAAEGWSPERCDKELGALKKYREEAPGKDWSNG